LNTKNSASFANVTNSKIEDTMIPEIAKESIAVSLTEYLSTSSKKVVFTVGGVFRIPSEEKNITIDDKPNPVGPGYGLLVTRFVVR